MILKYKDITKENTKENLQRFFLCSFSVANLLIVSACMDGNGQSPYSSNPAVNTEETAPISLSENMIYAGRDIGFVGASSCSISNDGSFISSMQRYIAGPGTVQFFFRDKADIQGFNSLIELLEQPPLELRNESMASDCGSVDRIGRNKDGQSFLITHIVENGCKGSYRKIAESVRNSDNYIWSNCENHQWFTSFYDKFNSLVRGFPSVEVLAAKEIVRKVYTDPVSNAEYRCSISQNGDFEGSNFTAGIVEIFKRNDDQWESIKTKNLSGDDISSIKKFITDIQQESKIISIEKMENSDDSAGPRDHLVLKLKANDQSAGVDVVVSGFVDGLNIPHYNEHLVKISGHMDLVAQAGEDLHTLDSPVIPPPSPSQNFLDFLEADVCKLEE